ncbi:Peptidoglycan-recognition protein LE [Gryllus bimaculatus]|nr:Peptidoglycan-recognition protein LE [Gryllus bimaculatus]
MGQTGATNFTLSGKLRIMQRKEWLAQPLAAPLPILTTPVPYVIISHTATEQCLKIAECILQVRTVQTFHIESRGWWDIGYNFLVGGDGFAYTGRGWDTIGAHAYGYNNVSIGISFIGTFNTVLPPARQLTAAKQLIELGVKLGKISENYKLLGHKQVSATESPGNVLYQELQKWPHWSEHP